MVNRLFVAVIRWYRPASVPVLNGAWGFSPVKATRSGRVQIIDKELWNV